MTSRQDVEAKVKGILDLIDAENGAKTAKDLEAIEKAQKAALAALAVDVLMTFARIADALEIIAKSHSPGTSFRNL